MNRHDLSKNLGDEYLKLGPLLVGISEFEISIKFCIFWLLILIFFTKNIFWVIIEIFENFQCKCEKLYILGLKL
jgi:hypothetical protein